MIEKIPDQIPVQTGEWGKTTFGIIPKETFGMACRKINEIVDAVHILQAQVAILQEHAHPTAKVDPCTEQRKWIGKLCRFWDDNSKITKHFGILTRIDETAIVPYEAGNGFWYCACEPVKPDDDIIYKGGDNE